MQAIPEPRQQTFEEIYAPPENFLEIEVRIFPRFPNSFISAPWVPRNPISCVILCLELTIHPIQHVYLTMLTPHQP